MKSVTYVESLGGDVPSPVVPAIHSKPLRNDWLPNSLTDTPLEPRVSRTDRPPPENRRMDWPFTRDAQAERHEALTPINYEQGLLLLRPAGKCDWGSSGIGRPQ